MIKCGVVIFPGSNCDHDAYHVAKHVMGFETVFLWHKDEDLKGCNFIVIPGGFSYGDYLRCGAIASFSPIMKSIKKFAEDGGLVLGICNGFQILLESGLLPGSLLRNKNLKFICKFVDICVERNDTPFTNSCEKKVLRIPIAHHDGCYFLEKEKLEELESNGQILFRYSSPEGEIDEEFNPNGSLKNIAGITNKNGNVLGMMPHPERASELLLGSFDGKFIFKSIFNYLEKGLKG